MSSRYLSVRVPLWQCHLSGAAGRDMIHRRPVQPAHHEEQDSSSGRAMGDDSRPRRHLDDASSSRPSSVICRGAVSWARRFSPTATDARHSSRDAPDSLTCTPSPIHNETSCLETHKTIHEMREYGHHTSTRTLAQLA